MKRGLLALALALMAGAVSAADAPGQGVLFLSLRLAPPAASVTRLSLYVQPVGDALHEFSITATNSGLLMADEPDAKNDRERIWTLTRVLAAGRYEILRTEICTVLGTGWKDMLAGREPTRFCIKGQPERPMAIDVKANGMVYAGRWEMSWGVSRFVFVDALAEDQPRAQAHLRADGQAGVDWPVDNPIAELLRQATAQ